MTSMLKDTILNAIVRIVRNRSLRIVSRVLQKHLHAFFCKQRIFHFFFWWIKLKMLLRCCITHAAIIILRDISYLVYLCPCLGLPAFMSYLYDLLFIFNLIFIAINHITSAVLFFCTFFRISPIVFGW